MFDTFSVKDAGADLTQKVADLTEIPVNWGVVYPESSHKIHLSSINGSLFRFMNHTVQ